MYVYNIQLYTKIQCISEINIYIVIIQSAIDIKSTYNFYKIIIINQDIYLYDLVPAVSSDTLLFKPILFLINIWNWYYMVELPFL